MEGRINTEEAGKWMGTVMTLTTIVMKVMAEKHALWIIVTVDEHGNSPQNITPQLHSKVTRKRKWSPAREALDCDTILYLPQWKMYKELSGECENGLKYFCFLINIKPENTQTILPNTT